MRAWFFHPLIFYPLVAVLAVLVIGFSLRPQSWPRPAAAVAAEVSGDTLVFRGAGFDAPAGSPEQEMTIVRDFSGRAQSLRIAVLPEQPAPGPRQLGVRLLLTEAQAALIANRPTRVEIDYAPLPVNAADGLAVSLQGSSPSVWVSLSAPPQPGTLRFELPPQTGPRAIGLRALSAGEGEAFGLEINAVRVTPQNAPAPAN